MLICLTAHISGTVGYILISVLNQLKSYGTKKTCSLWGIMEDSGALSKRLERTEGRETVGLLALLSPNCGQRRGR